MFQSKDFKFKNRCFLERQRARQLQTYWTAFSETISTQKREGEMNEAAKWFFWKSKSVVVLTQLYTYSQWSKKKKSAINAKRKEIKGMTFAAIKRRWFIKKAINNAFENTNTNTKANVLATLYEYSLIKR